MWRIDRCVFPDATAGDAGGFGNVWCKEADQTHDHTGGLSPDPYLYDTACPIHIYIWLVLRISAEVAQIFVSTEPKY